MLTKEHIDDLLNKDGNIISADGDKIGSIGQIYADDHNGQPTWVTARTGLFGTSESFIPLDGARLEGSDIVVPYTKDQVKDAPRVDADGHLEPSEEDRLYEHYQLIGAGTYGDTATGRNDVELDGRNANTERDVAFAAGRSGTYPAASAADTVGQDTSGPTTDEAMTRVEERLSGGTERQATGRARLRKYVTTENVTQTVPVQREELRLEREPVRVDTETMADEVTIDEQVRKEPIEADGVDGLHRR